MHDPSLSLRLWCVLPRAGELGLLVEMGKAIPEARAPWPSFPHCLFPNLPNPGHYLASFSFCILFVGTLLPFCNTLSPHPPPPFLSCRFLKRRPHLFHFLKLGFVSFCGDSVTISGFLVFTNHVLCPACISWRRSGAKVQLSFSPLTPLPFLVIL